MPSRYSKEFKAEAVRLFKAGNKPVAQLARELGVAVGTVRTWASRAEADEGNGGSGVQRSSGRLDGSPAKSFSVGLS